MKKSINMPLVWFSGVLTLCAGLITFSVSSHFSRTGSILKQDGLVYFLYARSLVIDHDLLVTSELPDALKRFNPETTESINRYARRNAQTGQITLPWPAGSGAIMAPFYMLGYGVECVAAHFSGRPADTYGAIPIYFFGFGALAFGLVGFWFTFLCCREVSDSPTAYLCALGIVLGGPLVFYIFFQPTMSHAQSFGITSIFTLLWWRNWQGRSFDPIWLGLLWGVMITIRYQNALFGVLLAALVLREIRQRPFSEAMRRLAPGALAFAVPIALEAVHWVATHGFSLAAMGTSNPTGFVAEENGIDLRSPKFFYVLFSSLHGAFYWAPILGLGFAGLVWAARNEAWARIFIITFLCQTYVIGGLSGGAGNWHGAAAFGMRYLAECGVMLAMGLAFLVQASSNRIRASRWRLVVGGLVIWNGLLIVAFSLRTIPQLEGVTYVAMAKGMALALSKFGKM